MNPLKINRGGSMTTALLKFGRKPDPGRKRQAEECSGRLTVRAWLDGDAPADVGTLGLVVTRPHFGGERRWFASPACGGRVGVLYRPDDGDPWRCRRCHGLAYRSAQRAYEGERLWVAFRRIFDHLEANGGWGRAEDLFDGLGHAEATAMGRAILYLDMGELEAMRAALGVAIGGPADGRPGHPGLPVANGQKPTLRLAGPET